MSSFKIQLNTVNACGNVAIAHITYRIIPFGLQLVCLCRIELITALPTASPLCASFIWWFGFKLQTIFDNHTVGTTKDIGWVLDGNTAIW